MIDVKDGNSNEMWVTYYCPECEAATGVPCELTVNYARRSREEMQMRARIIKRFDLIHDQCGLAEIDGRMKTFFPKMYADPPMLP